MNRFAALFTELDQTGSTKAKTDALAAYFRAAPENDRLWTIALLSGRRPKRLVPAARLREWAAERAGLSQWLFEESYGVVGDLAETIALVLPPPSRADLRSLTEWIAYLRALAPAGEAQKRAGMLAAWDGLETTERLVLNKLCTGGFRVGVSAKLMMRALAQATDIPEPEIAHRLMGQWHPDTHSWGALIEAPDPDADLSRPYPFQLAHGLEGAPEALGPADTWLAEWKWDGIRGQLIRRGGQMFLWSRGEDLVTDRFPEFAPLLDFLPDGTVMDGEVLAWDAPTERPLPFAALQKRIGRRTVSKAVVQKYPAVFMAYDLLERGGADMRAQPLAARRAQLSDICKPALDIPLRLSVQLSDNWTTLAEHRASARDLGAEGLMLKRLSAPYLGGRKKGDWFKWKLDPLSIDAVMIYAQAGHGRRANLFTDYTFGVWKDGDLVPFAKAYSGLSDDEFRQITHWVKRNTLERFGPVRRVPPQQVFEVAFEGIQASKRHKSGVALRFPRIARWRQDKTPDQANSHDDLLEMLAQYGQVPP